MLELRDILGPAGYGAAWLLLERIAEAWDGNGEPELCLSLQEWKYVCGVSSQKFQKLIEILQQHTIIQTENVRFRLLVKASILLQLQDEWTRRVRQNSKVTPELVGSHFGAQTETDNRRKTDKNTPPGASLSYQVAGVFRRHGIMPGSDRARHIVSHLEDRQPQNPGGYLESILQRKPDFDPMPQAYEDGTINNRQQGPTATGDILRRMGMVQPPRTDSGDHEDG